MARFGKRTRETRASLVADKEYSLSEAIEVLCSCAQGEV